MIHLSSMELICAVNSEPCPLKLLPMVGCLHYWWAISSIGSFLYWRHYATDLILPSACAHRCRAPVLVISASCCSLCWCLIQVVWQFFALDHAATVKFQAAPIPEILSEVGIVNVLRRNSLLCRLLIVVIHHLDCGLLGDSTIAITLTTRLKIVLTMITTV